MSTEARVGNSSGLVVLPLLSFPKGNPVPVPSINKFIRIAKGPACCFMVAMIKKGQMKTRVGDKPSPAEQFYALAA